MIRKVTTVHPNSWNGKGKPVKGDLLLMYNPVFGNDDYTRHYKDIPNDTVYVVTHVTSSGNRVILPTTNAYTSGDYQTFSCSDGFDKHFRPYTTTKGAINGLTLD